MVFQRSRKWIGFIVVAVTLCMAGSLTVYAAPFWTETKQSPKKFEITNETVPNLVKDLKPSVVNIGVVKVERIHGGPMPGREFGPFGESDQFKDFWERFFGNRIPKEYRQRGLGSGFIISTDGYIMTNNHVIQGADEIQVVLHDKQEYPATIIGTDPKTDIALIKIEPKEDLIVAVLGDSDQLEQGEPVLAIGNPFGLSETVTTGIVSATGRVIGAGPYDNFIQTDASINPGNSGGPLFNFSGDVVGINSAIVASGQGIGFAVPINSAKEILLQLKDKGRVTRGWLGVTIQNVTPELAKSFKLEDRKGALVADVSEGGPASESHIRRGDVIVEFNGQPVENSQVLPQMVGSLMPGTEVGVAVMREGKKIVFKLKLGTLEDDTMVASETTQRKRLGIGIQTVTPELAKGLGMETAQGVAVTAVEPGSPAVEAGLRRGDVILEVDQQAVNTVEEFKKNTAENSSESVLLLVWRQGSTFFVTLQMK